jgi:uncharacterized protein YecE (DUF72 family)
MASRLAPRQALERMERPRARVRVGISGFRYPEWRGVFYPRGLRHADELRYASRRFDTIELNGSFYSLGRPERYARWYAETPRRFLFSVKGGRYITHMLKLRNAETALANFFASGPLQLKEKLGPILWQFPESIPLDERFEKFFELLPHDTREAAMLARRHDATLEGGAMLAAGARRPVRHAVEIRSRSFRTPEFGALLRKYDVALVVADTARRWPRFEMATTDFMYVRLHGHRKLYESQYSRATLRRWSRKIAAWTSARNVYVYFDNSAKAHAPFDAVTLARMLGTFPTNHR